jgi:thiamine-monophosphate kinase
MYAGEKVRPASAKAYFYAQPRLEVGLEMRGLASAMIDISDGLSTDLSHICEESKVGALVYASRIPVAKRATLDDALYGGDDYELLFTSAKLIPSAIAGVSITEIGEIVNRSGMWIQDERGRTRRLKAQGWEHFAEESK